MYAVVRSCVRYNNHHSDFFESHIGLKQGDPSSPLLFMFFVNDLSLNINTDLDDIFTLNEIKYFLLLYAHRSGTIRQVSDCVTINDKRSG